MPAGTERPDSLQYELQEAAENQFQAPVVVYQGADLATVLSGRSNATWYYRVRALQDGAPVSNWSASLRVEIRHHSLARALTFFSLGAVVFVLTLLLVLRGVRHQTDDEQPMQG